MDVSRTCRKAQRTLEWQGGTHGEWGAVQDLNNADMTI